MTYQTTITQKGQIVIPRDLRVFLGLRENIKIILELDKLSKTIKIQPAPTILDLAGKFKPKKITTATKLRDKMTHLYETR